MSDIEGKAAREAVSERSRGDASDIDGQTERSKWAGAHESTRAVKEFQKIKKFWFPFLLPHSPELAGLDAESLCLWPQL